VILLLIGSSHVALDASTAASLPNFRVFQQPARAWPDGWREEGFFVASLLRMTAFFSG